MAMILLWGAQIGAQESGDPTVEGESQEVVEEPEELEEGQEAEEESTEAEEIEEETPSVEDELEQRRLTLLLTGNMDGNFARVNCREEEGFTRLYWAEQAAYIHTMEALTESTGLARPLSFNVGGSIYPGALTRYLVTLTEGGSRTQADLLAQIPLEVHGAGSREFSVPRSYLLDFGEAMRERGIALQASNLECAAFAGAEAICDVTGGEERRFDVVERQGVRVAVATVLAENVLDALASAQREGLTIVDPAEMLPGLIEEMREEADLVVVQYQVRSSDALARSHDLASQVQGIDLLVASQSLTGPRQGEESVAAQGVEGNLMSMIQARHTGTPIVSADSGEQSVINVEFTVTSRPDGQGRWSVSSVTPRRVSTADMPAHPDTARALHATIEAFCEDWGIPIGEDANLDEPFQIEDLHTFVLNVMRFSTRSEVALSNRGAFRNEDQFPLTGALTLADVYTALPFQNNMVTAQIRGSVLKAVAGRLGGDLLGAGIEVEGSRVLINGRPAVDERFYRVALNDYLAEGGDGVFTVEQLVDAQVYHPGWSTDPPAVENVVVRFVETGGHTRLGRVSDGVSGEGNFPDLHRNFLWTFTGSLNASYQQVTVQNPTVNDAPGYDQSQLAVQSADQINVEARLTARADSRNHGWNNILDTQYATTRISDEEDSTFEETKDQIRYRSQYRYQGWRAANPDRWYVPQPLLEGQLESEFTIPETRDWRRLDLRGILGLSFQVFDPLDLRVGANIRQELNDPEAEPTWGVNLGYTLRRIDLVSFAGRPIQFESEVEYFYNDIARTNIHEVRSNNRLFYAVFDQFFFTTTFNAFLFRNDVVGDWGTNTELTIGLHYQWDAARQNF